MYICQNRLSEVFLHIMLLNNQDSLARPWMVTSLISPHNNHSHTISRTLCWTRITNNAVANKPYCAYKYINIIINQTLQHILNHKTMFLIFKYDKSVKSDSSYCSLDKRTYRIYFKACWIYSLIYTITI